MLRKINLKLTVTLLLLLFVLYSLFIVFNTNVTTFDMNVIEFVQHALVNVPVWMITLFDTELYCALIAIPLLFGNFYFLKKYLIIDILIFSSTPLVAFLLNTVIKNIVRRQRPPLGMQISVHPSSFSFVSSHTLIIFCLLGMSIYYINLYCKNKILKMFLILFSVICIISEAFSRIWLGVHYPTDVLGAILLGSIFLIIYIRLAEKIGGQ